MDTKRQWILVTALIGVVTLVAGFMFMVMPQYKKADSVNKDAKTVAAQIETLRTRLKVLTAQQSQLSAKQAELAALALKVPPSENLADLTRQLQAAAENIPQAPTAGRAVPGPGYVDLSVLVPAAPTALTATGTSTTAGSAPAGGATAGAADVLQVPLTMTVSGTFFNVEAFLDRLESLNRAILIDGFSVTYQGTALDPKMPGTGQLTVTLNARAFMTTAPLTAATAQ